MIRSDKKVKELSVLLSNTDSLLIAEGIALLREEEPFEGAVGLLASFYDNTEDMPVKRNIEGFLNDIKDQSVRKEIMTEIKKPLKQATITMLLASCWQSGLDYSDFTRDLADIFLKSDYLTALECLTVIEESVHELGKAKKNEILKIIEEYPTESSNEKSNLTRELILILKQD